MVPQHLLSAETDAAESALGDAGERLRRALSPRYLVERKLARGGMGLVFLARDTHHDRLVAIKLLDPERAAAIGGERFRREIQAAAQLVHPNILPVFESGDADGLLYYVMPYVEGDSLRDLLSRKGPLPVEDAVALAADLAEALDCAHRHGVIHRDVKPENVLLPAPHHACLTDFGVAHAPAGSADPHLTSAGRLMGSPLYMSPEQAAGYADVDGRADVYGLGCVLFEMLAGRPPFTGERVETVLVGHLSEMPPPLRTLRPDAPPWLEGTVARTLAKLPEERFATAGELAEALRNGWRTGAGEVAAIPVAAPAGREMPHWPRRRSILLVAIVGLAAAAATGVWLWRGAHAKAPGLDPNRIAVLYFEDLSPRKELGYLANGLTESLIERLTRVPALDVVSANGVQPFRGRALSPDSIARVLRAGTLVGGNVQVSGKRLRVTVHLVDTGTGSPTASTIVERTSGDPLALEDSVADEVARFLRQRLGQQIRLQRLRAETRNARAWTFFHEADELRQGVRDVQPFADSMSFATASTLLYRADSLYARAERADPGWIAPTLERGWLALEQADLRALDQVWNERWLRAGEQRAAAAAARAPGDAGVLELLGKLAYRRGFNASSATVAQRAYAEAERDLRAATRADPSRASAWSTLSNVLRLQGRFPEASVVARRALHEDAYLSDARQIVFGLFISAYGLGEMQAADEWCARGESEFLDDPRFPQCRLQLMAIGGVGRADPQRAWQLLAEIDRRIGRGQGREADPDLRIFRRALVAGVLARAGLTDSARALLQRIRAEAAPDRDLYARRFAVYAAQVDLLLGDNDAALKWLAVYLAAEPTGRAWVASDFSFRTLHGNARFQALVRARP